MRAMIMKLRIYSVLAMAGLLVSACAGAIPRVDQPQTSSSTSNTANRPYIAPPPERRDPPRLAEGPTSGLEQAVRALGAGFNGDVGIAIQDVEQGWTVSWNGDRFFPQQSVSKMWVALAVLDQVDRGSLSLNQNVRVTRDDFVIFHQPMRSLVGRNGYQTTLNYLFEQSMTRSDNLANDKMLWISGGPTAVNNYLRRNDLDGLRFGPGERLLQAGIAGLEWRQSYATGRNFYTARANLPASTRRASMDRYLADPVDGATPDGMVSALARLQRGELLSARSTQVMLSAMRRSRTGPQRLRGGVPSGWTFGHKTGTGQNHQGRVAGYNDVGIVTAPDGHSYSVAVLIGETRVGIPERQRLMQNVMGRIVTHHLQRQRERRNR